MWWNRHNFFVFLFSKLKTSWIAPDWWNCSNWLFSRSPFNFPRYFLPVNLEMKLISVARCRSNLSIQTEIYSVDRVFKTGCMAQLWWLVEKVPRSACDHLPKYLWCTWSVGWNADIVGLSSNIGVVIALKIPHTSHWLKEPSNTQYCVYEHIGKHSIDVLPSRDNIDGIGSEKKTSAR